MNLCQLVLHLHAAALEQKRRVELGRVARPEIREHGLYRVAENETCVVPICGALHAHSHPVCHACWTVGFHNGDNCLECGAQCRGYSNPIMLNGAVIDGPRK